MRKVCILIVAVLVSLSLSAQETKSLSTVILNNGMSINGYVEPQADGGYKVTSESGDVFYYSSSDVKRINGNLSPEVQRDLKYWQYKKMYNARDYSYELGDKYRVGGVGAASFLFPGLGQYITGCQVGFGILQTVVFGAGITTIIHAYHYYDRNWDYKPNADFDTHLCVGIAMVASMSLWSGFSAIKAAKIKNLYLRDKSHGSIEVGVKPYLSFDPMSLQNNSLKPVFGATLTLNI